MPQVVFVSLTGAGRAQVAAAILARRAGDTLGVHCAGQAISAEIEDNVRTALSEVGIDLTDAFNRPLTDEILARADVVVTMGYSVGQVAIPGSARHVDWRVGDPTGADLDEVRRVREDIERRVHGLVEELTASRAVPAA
ncbi:MAG TPA: low molecular weight phosphatase family protein [Gaiellaceae bacterium]|nr:low molecular weight phosphatase family protein [Gaiellaceae bacterium]